MRTGPAVSVAAGDQSTDGLPGPVLETRGERVAGCAEMLPEWRLRTTGPSCADRRDRLFAARVVPDNADVKPVPRLLLGTSTARQRRSTSRAPH